MAYAEERVDIEGGQDASGCGLLRSECHTPVA